MRLRERNSRSGTSGWGCRVSMTTNSGEQHDAEREIAQHQRGTPGVAVGGHDPVDERDQPAGDRERAGPVERRPVALGARLGDGEPRDDQDEDADRHVDEQDPAPGQQVGQHAARDHAGGAPGAGHGAPGAERSGARTRIGERRGEDRQRRRREHRAADALQRPGTDQLATGLGEAAEQRGHREQRHPDEEQPAPAPQVRRASAEQQEAREGQGVGVQHPAERVLRHVQVGLHRRQRDIHDADVEHDHELGDADDGENERVGPGTGGIRAAADEVAGGHPMASTPRRRVIPFSECRLPGRSQVHVRHARARVDPPPEGAGELLVRSVPSAS